MSMLLTKQKSDNGYEEMPQKIATLLWCKPLVITNGFQMLYNRTIGIEK
jgi:hypothetical protein